MPIGPKCITRATPLNRPRPKRPSSASAPTNEAALNAPNSSSAQAPTDMGDQYLNIGQPVFDWISMCQNRSGRPRSTISRMPQITTSGKAI